MSSSAVQPKQNSDHIRLLTRSREGFWARCLDRENRLAEVDNCLFSTNRYTCGDIVKYSERGVVSRVVEKRYDSGVVSYPIGATREETLERVKTIRKHYEDAGCRTEPLIAGLIGVAFPISMTPEERTNLCVHCPAPLTGDLGALLEA